MVRSGHTEILSAGGSSSRQRVSQVKRLELKVADLECLDLITRYGPLSPSALARRAVGRCPSPGDRSPYLLRAGR